MKSSSFVPIVLLLVNGASQADVTTLARVRASGDITVAPNGDLYISDFGNPALGNGTSVVRVRPDGSQNLVVSGLPRALAGNDFDAQGNLIQAAFGGNQIYLIDPQGNASVLAALTGPVGIVVDDNDTIYSTECQANAISRIDRDGTVTRIAVGGGLNCPNGIDIGHDGAFYVVNNPDGGMFRVGLDGSVSLFATIPGGGNGHVVFAGGNYYVAGRVGHRVYAVDTDGNVTPYAGTGVDGDDDGPNLEATVSRPNGIGASPDGRFLYIVGSSNFAAPDLPLRQIDLPQQDDFEINAGLSGAWFELATGGQGMLFDVVPDTRTFFVAWFTFDTAASPKLGSPAQKWFTAQGAYQGNRAELDIVLTEGGLFDDPAAVINTATGTAVVSFAGCTQATFDYAFDDGLQGQIDLIRLSPDELCTVATSMKTQAER